LWEKTTKENSSGEAESIRFGVPLGRFLVMCDQQIRRNFIFYRYGDRARALLIPARMEEEHMEQLNQPTEAAVLQLQEMLNTPIEDQAASYELALLGTILQNGLQLLENSESSEETAEILRHMLKSAFVIGRRHINQLV
jgi:hypothetical protein